MGIVYNFHHGHEHVADFPKSLAEMLPYLICLNLNGMAEPASVDGNKNKILPIGTGKHEREMIREIVKQGYTGPIGILDHRNELDSEEVTAAKPRRIGKPSRPASIDSIGCPETFSYSQTE